MSQIDAQASFDLVVSNPPYIPSAELSALPTEVREYEPLEALDGGEDGLELYRRLLDQAKILLKPGGMLAVELYETKLTQATALAHAAGFNSVSTHLDLTGRMRFLTARLTCSHERSEGSCHTADVDGLQNNMTRTSDNCVEEPFSA